MGEPRKLPKTITLERLPGRAWIAKTRTEAGERTAEGETLREARLALLRLIESDSAQS